MNGNIWDKFDREIDTEGLAKDVEEAAANGGGNFKESLHAGIPMKWRSTSWK